jgi:glutathione S-transferase
MIESTLKIVDFETAIASPGLRLVTAAFVPSPWSEAAKAIFTAKKLPFVVAKTLGSNPAFQGWGRATNVPVLLKDDEPPRTAWFDILMVAERLSREPALIPTSAEGRARHFGVAHEILGEDGLLWNARLLGVDVSIETNGAKSFPLQVAQRLAPLYGWSKGCATRAGERTRESLAFVDRELAKSSGPYFFGDRMTALDIYSATAFGALAPLPDAHCPMMPVLRATFENIGASVGPLPPALLAHRARMYEEHLEVPLAI